MFNGTTEVVRTINAINQTSQLNEFIIVILQTRAEWIFPDLFE